MSEREVRYKLEMRFTVIKEERFNGESDFWRQTQERLTIDDNMELPSGMALTHALGLIDDVHNVIRESIHTT